MQMDATLHMDYFKKFALAAHASFGVAVLRFCRHVCLPGCMFVLLYGSLI